MRRAWQRVNVWARGAWETLCAVMSSVAIDHDLGYTVGDAPTAQGMAASAAELRDRVAMLQEELSASQLRVRQLGADLGIARTQIADLLGWSADGALTCDEMLRLVHLTQDCADLQFVATKLLRDGWVAGPGRPLRSRLEEKLGHLLAQIDVLTAAKDVRRGDINAYRTRRNAEAAQPKETVAGR